MCFDGSHAFLYLHVFQNQHSLVTIGACAIELDDVSVVADRFQDLHLLHVAEQVSCQLSQKLC